VKRLMADYDAGSPDLLDRRAALKDNLLDRTKTYLDGVATNPIPPRRAE